MEKKDPKSGLFVAAPLITEVPSKKSANINPRWASEPDPYNNGVIGPKSMAF